MENLTSPFLLTLQESNSTYGYHTPWGNSIKASYWSHIIESLASVERCERKDVLQKSELLMNESMNCDDYSKIIDSVSSVSCNERARFISNPLLHQLSGSDRTALIAIFAKIPIDQVDYIIETFEILSKRSIREKCYGNHDSKIIERIAKIPAQSRRNALISSLPLCMNLTERFGLGSSPDERKLKILESVAEIPIESRDNVIFHALKLCNNEKDSDSLSITPADGAPKITMPSYPTAIIIASIAKVGPEERNELVNLTKKYNIKQHGDGYTALVIQEIARMPADKRGLVVQSYSLGREMRISPSIEKSSGSIERGFQFYLDYLLNTTFCELFRLRLICAVSRMPEVYKRRISKYMRSVFPKIPDSIIGDILIKVGHHLSQV